MKILRPSTEYRSSRLATIEMIERKIERTTLPIMDIWGLAGMCYLACVIVAKFVGLDGGTVFQMAWVVSAMLVVLLLPAGLLSVCIRCIFINALLDTTSREKEKNRGENA